MGGRASFQRVSLAVAAAGVLIAGTSGRAHAQQSPPRTARVQVTVVDPSGAVVANASVTIAPADPAANAIPVARTSPQGLAMFESLVPSRYTITAEFPGFEPGILKDVDLRAGDNRHVIALPLKGVRDTVNVAQDRQAAAATRTGPTFGLSLSREQIEALSDDPAELALQLQELVGPDGIIRVDSFEGAQLPPKSQIKAVHVTRDSFAAENHSAGAVFVDVITQPGSGPLRGNGNLGFQDGALTGRSPFVPVKGPEQSKSFNAGLSGTLVTNKLSFSMSAGQSFFYDTPNLNAALPNGTQSVALNLRRPRNSNNLYVNVDYAISRDQTLRGWYSQSGSLGENLGVGAYDLPERAYSSRSRSYNVRVQHGGPIGRRLFWNTRLDWFRSVGISTPTLEAPTIRVTDAFTAGGAQVKGERRTHDLRVQSDVDYVRGRHSIRSGVDLWGTWYHSSDATNYLGTYTFASLDDYTAGRPTFYTRRIGDPLIEYLEVWAGGYMQDDIRVRKGLTLSPGVRYEWENLLEGRHSIGPRVGMTWAPFQSGRTSVRASIGLFYDWVSAGVYEPTLRVDGLRQRELNIVNPPYPDPGTQGTVPPTNKFLFGDDVRMGRNVRVSLGLEQSFTSKWRGSVLYSGTRGTHLLRGRNLNAPVGGVRPDPAFGSVIETVTDARAMSQQAAISTSYNIAPSAGAASQARFSWRRMSVNGSYTWNRASNDTDGPFAVPASGVLATEWGPSAGDVRHRLSTGLSSTALRNASATLTLNLSSGRPYTMTTGLDDDGDVIFNDRPPNVGRGTLRYPWTWTLAGSVSYSFTAGHRTVPQPGGVGITITNGVPTVNTAPSTSARFRFTFSVRMSNLTNHTNYTGFSGVMTSPFFRIATAANEPRRVNFSLTTSF